ncbi:hypothetical protein ACQ4PT_064845 [Festuca glaucescens]
MESPQVGARLLVIGVAAMELPAVGWAVVFFQRMTAALSCGAAARALSLLLWRSMELFIRRNLMPRWICWVIFRLLMHSRWNHGCGGEGESLEEIDVVPDGEHRHGWRSKMARFVCGDSGTGDSAEQSWTVLDGSVYPPFAWFSSSGVMLGPLVNTKLNSGSYGVLGDKPYSGSQPGIMSLNKAEASPTEQGYKSSPKNAGTGVYLEKRYSMEEIVTSGGIPAKTTETRSSE